MSAHAGSASFLRSRFFWKLYGGALLLILLTALATALFIDRDVERRASDDLERGLAAKATLLAELGFPAGAQTTGLTERVRALGASTATRLTVIDAVGRVLADSDEDPLHMDNHLARPEIDAANRTGRGSATRFSASTGKETRYVAVRVERAGQTVGFARAALETRSIRESLAGVRAAIALAAGAAAIGALLVALPIARAVTVPIRAITRAAEAIERGENGVDLPPARNDEIGRLASSFGAMSRELESRMQVLAADRNKVLAILASMVEGVVAVDREERVVHMNVAAARILRADRDGGLGRRIWEVTRVVEVSQILDEAARKSSESRGEVRIADGGMERTVELFAAPLVGSAGEKAGAVVVLHDVTELRRLEGVRRDFVANVSHELKTPLTAIRGLVETVLDDPSMPPATQRRFMEKIRDQSGRLTAVVLDLLTLGRIESQESPLDLREIDLRALIRECVERLAPLVEQKSLSLRLDLPDAPAVVRGDEEALRQVVGNLLDNAVKYTPSRGSIRAGARFDGPEVAVEVADTGIGIEPRDQERIFERFYRVDKARSRELGGTGLGLSIVKHLALSMNGRVSVESTPGKGSTFRVHLPRLPASG